MTFTTSSRSRSPMDDSSAACAASSSAARASRSRPAASVSRGSRRSAHGMTRRATVGLTIASSPSSSSSSERFRTSRSTCSGVMAVTRGARGFGTQRVPNGGTEVARPVTPGRDDRARFAGRLGPHAVAGPGPMRERVGRAGTHRLPARAARARRSVERQPTSPTTGTAPRPGGEPGSAGAPRRRDPAHVSPRSSRTETDSRPAQRSC